MNKVKVTSKGTSRNSGGRGFHRAPRGGRSSNPARAYAGEQTYKHRYQAVYLASNATPLGYVESVNLGVIDDYSVLASQWATWRIDSFTVRIRPVNSVNGAYSARPFECLSTGSTPVVPTNIATVMDGGGKLKAATNFAENVITLRWRSLQVASKAFTSTSSSTNDNFGDPGWMMYVSANAFAMYAVADIVFEFREATGYATQARLRIMSAPATDDVTSEESETEIVVVKSKKKPTASSRVD